MKYHQGAIGIRKTKAGRDIRIELSCNPSHLEFVNPVVEGMARGKQDDLRNGEQTRLAKRSYDIVMPVLLHGDAAFAGQGIVMETLQLANLPGYRTGGTIHIVINNQIGFTTVAGTRPQLDLFNRRRADHADADLPHQRRRPRKRRIRVIQIALDYRHEFNKDVVLDLVGFRRLGHNEGDEPSYTQPVMYARVKAHPGHAASVCAASDPRRCDHRRRPECDDRQGRRKIRRHPGTRKTDRGGETEDRTALAPPVVDEDGSTCFETGADRATF